MGEVFGLVGEFGLRQERLRPQPAAPDRPPGSDRRRHGSLRRDNRLASSTSEQMTDMRGSQISMIFQQPQSSLNPVFSVGDQIAEVLRLHMGMDKAPGLGPCRRTVGLVGHSRRRDRACTPTRTRCPAGRRSGS